MGQPARSGRQPAGAVKPCSTPAKRPAKRRGRVAGLLWVGILGGAALTVAVANRWIVLDSDVSDRAQAMPRANPISTLAAVTTSTSSSPAPTSGGTTPLGVDRIQLDPICQPIEPPLPPLPPGDPGPGTRRMARRLATMSEHAKPSTKGFMSDRVVRMLERELATTTGVNEQIQLRFSLGSQQINASRPDLALNTFAELERFTIENNGNFDRQSRSELRILKALAFLRLGEQENCLTTHNADSCLFPLHPNAYHHLPRGSRGAIALLEKQLAAEPGDFRARWLINLAHMTLGEYPDRVNPKYLIPPERFDSEFDLPRFPDVSLGLGLDVNNLAGGAIVDDFDNDGSYDVVVSAWNWEGRLRYFHNDGEGRFSERTSQAGLVGEVSALNIQQTDYNNDDLLDIWLLRGAWLGNAGRIPNSLLRNNGDGTFEDVTDQAGLLSYHPTQTSRWFDFDGDGWLDLFVGNESTDPASPDWCELFRNNQDGTFTECSQSTGIRVAVFVKGVACADYDNDGRPDLFLSVRDHQGSILLHNDGPDATGQWRFSNRTVQAGLTGKTPTFGTFFFDYDNDGWEDLAVLGYSLPSGVGDVALDYLGMPNPGAKQFLYRNNRDGTFADVTAAARMDRIVHAMGHNYGDLDNDGWLDIYCATGDPDFTTLIPNRMFRNAAGKVFQDVTTATGTGHIQKGHGVAFADMDEDGDQDIYVAMGGAYSGDLARNALFLNPVNTHRWLKLRLVGAKANRAAIGARVKVTLDTPSGSREIHRVVSSGGSFGSNPLRLEIGLGDATAIAAVDILWPGSNTRQTLMGLELNHGYQVREGDSQVVPLELRPAQFTRPARAQGH